MSAALTLLALAASLAPAGAQVRERPPAPPPAEMSQEEAAVARDRAVGWLVRAQRADGSFGYGFADHLFDLGFAWETYYSYRMSAHALACEALRAAPETPARRAALERAFEWLVDARIPVRGADWDVDSTWASLYAFVALVAAAADPRFAGTPFGERLSAKGVAFWEDLARRQTAEGGWAYYDDRPFTERPTWATSFCTALVLPAMIQARAELGWPVGAGHVERAVQYVRRCAQPNGAYSYDFRILPRPWAGEHVNQVPGSLGRIQVCNWALARAGVRWVDAERVRAGLAAFFREHRFMDLARLRPIPHEGRFANAGYFYHFAHYYAAQAIGLLPADEREGWHRRLRPKIVKTLGPDGATTDFLTASYQLVAGASYAALALTLGLADEAVEESPR